MPDPPPLDWQYLDGPRLLSLLWAKTMWPLVWWQGHCVAKTRPTISVLLHPGQGAQNRVEKLAHYKWSLLHPRGPQQMDWCPAVAGFTPLPSLPQEQLTLLG
jgi:hypothetical protein